MDKRPQTIKGYCIFMPNLYLKLANLSDARQIWLKIYASNNRFRSIVGVLFQLIFRMAQLSVHHKL